MSTILKGQQRENSNYFIPKNLKDQEPGFVFGTKPVRGRWYKFFESGHSSSKRNVVKPENVEGHIASFGGSGSGKTSGLASPTCCNWEKGTMFVIDIKGSLLKDFQRHGNGNKRPFKVIDFSGKLENVCRIDLFHAVRHGGNQQVQYARELAESIIPLPNDTREPFWLLSARNILTAAFLYYTNIGVGFIDAIIEIKTTPLGLLLEKISTDATAKVCICPDVCLNSKMLAGISEEMHNHIVIFATDEAVQDTFSPPEDDPGNIVKWEDLETHNVFINIDLDKLDQMRGIIASMLTQLIRTLERRPDKFSPEGCNMPPVLLLLDEFPRLGKLEVITNSLATLRSKGVTIALFLQSLADLDAIYGQATRRRILDNTLYKVILNAADAETQQYLSALVGTKKVFTKGASVSYNSFGKIASPTVGIQISESFQPLVHPHEFALLKDIVLITPDGVCRVDKLPYNNSFNLHNREPFINLAISKLDTSELELPEVSRNTRCRVNLLGLKSNN